MLIKKITTIICSCIALGAAAQTTQSVDICIYGGSSAGVIAAYTAKKSGKSVLLIEPGKRLGGLSSGGLGYTDIGNKYAVTGLALDFYRRIGRHYGKFESWIFEPSVAEQTFAWYIKAANVEVLYNAALFEVKKEQGYIREIEVNDPLSPKPQTARKIKAKMFIDCSYEGDLLAKAGVSYTVGREANSQYNETYNGVQLREKHQFPDGIDPYKVPGKPESGLIWGVSNATLDPQGQGDKKVQAYNFRICLTSNPGNLIPITQPDNYDPARYELLLRLLAKKPVGDLWGFLKFDLMPNQKTDINNNNAFSTDMIGMNYDYPEADYATRKKITDQHTDYIKGLLYFIGHDPRMPEHLRNLMLKWGYPKDEYTESGNWSPQMYVREARRMVGQYVMTQANCEGKEVVKDGVGMAAYTMDSHNCQRLVVNGMVKNEGDVQIGGFGPYPIAYRCIIPKTEDCKNLLVPVCLSATHIAYGSIRMEPVFMVLGQSAAVAAAMAIDAKKPVQEVNIAKLQAAIKNNPLANGSIPEIIVDNDDKEKVRTTGQWTSQKGGYGPSHLLAQQSDKEKRSVTFTPVITRGGKYDVYVYLPKTANMAKEIVLQVFDGNKKNPASVHPASIQVAGQTSGEWVSIGSYQLPAGKKSYVEIAADGPGGTVVADAVLLIPR
ncbi:FAD-dependent oxidoreductase [Paraflavitalea soli]|uniref:FAD-dependent oxidoreductase n=1 Tax=Paraflavitalea soli TaxID=2315862 RepID=A0A3B7MW06_9BACT|nr:FAD-dependent oxidoreductase [Paraflavitalea soli]AXY77613.1 FAD-dependent oxidoreductase [Paraflavitalea soli]